MQNELVAHIQAKNEASRAWVAEDPKNRWAGGLVEDPAHWEKYGVTTPAELDKYLIACDVYELTRSVWNFKPSWAGLMGSTVEELTEERERLIRQGNEERERVREERIARKLAAKREEAAQEAAEARARTREEWTLGGAFAMAGL